MVNENVITAGQHEVSGPQNVRTAHHQKINRILKCAAVKPGDLKSKKIKAGLTSQTITQLLD